METLILLVAPVQDSVARNAQHHTGMSFGVFILIVFGAYFGLTALCYLFNWILKKTDGYCSTKDLFFMPVANIGCLICRLSQFLRPKVIKDFRRNNKKNRDAAKAKKMKERDEKIKAHTKGLLDI